MNEALSITTERLHIILVNDAYTEDIFRELTPAVSQYLSFDPTGNIEDVRSFIARAQKDIQNGSDFPVVILDKHTGAFLGCAGIHRISTGKPELGIWLKQTAQGQGIGKETIQGLLVWAKQHLPYDCIYYPVAKQNIRSINLVKSLGGIIDCEKNVVSSSGKKLEEIIYKVRI